MKPKIKLATSREIYNRILWDSSFNQRVFFIQFIDRVSSTGLREKPLIEWAGSDIPWSRVQSIRCGDKIVWDRNLRIDLFASNHLPKEAYLISQENNLIVQEDIFVQKSVYQYINDVWTFYTKGIQDSVGQESVSIVSWNILAEHYEKEYFEMRYDAIFKELQNVDADVVVLQEVTSYFLEELMKQSWVREMYVSALPNDMKDRKHGVVIISKMPFSLVEFTYSFAKHFPVATWNLNGKYVSVAGVHLSSNFDGDKSDIRKKQLNQLIDYLEQQNNPYWITGDFNMRGNEELGSTLQKYQISDCWLQRNSNDEGYTFDPSVNEFAKQATQTNLPARFDRMLQKTNEWELAEISYFAQEAVLHNNLHLSDHYGVFAHFSFNEKKNEVNHLQIVKPTYESGIVIIPPKSVWKSIQSLREKYDAKAYRWMPHITMIYGFLPEEHFEEATQLVADKLKGFPGFEVKLSEYQTFLHRNKETVWLNPVTENHILVHLQSIIQDCFPQCNEQLKGLQGFTPHMSIGQFSTKEEAFKKLPQWNSINFPVESIAFISRKGNLPFEEKYRIYLGTGEIELVDEKLKSQNQLMQIINEQLPVMDIEQKNHRKMVVDFVETACQEVLEYPVELYSVGSTYLGTDTIKSDMDMLCLIPNHYTQLEFLQLVAIELDGFVSKLNLVEDAQVPTLRMEIEGVGVDLLCAQNPHFPAPIYQINIGDYHQFSVESWQALSSYFEAQKLMTLVQSNVRLSTFQNFLKAIRIWTSARKIKGNASGYLGTYSWTVLAVSTILEFTDSNQINCLEVLLKAFFRKMKATDWTKGIALTEEGKNAKVRPKQDRMPVFTTITPCFNSARNITQSTVQTLQQEFERAVEMTQKSKVDWEALLEEKELKGYELKVCVQSENTKALNIAKGWIEGHLLGLMISLEQNNLYVQLSAEFVEEEESYCTKLYVSDEISNSMIDDFINRFDQENPLVKLIIM
ncbi:MAG: DUF504 domain-containing protein [Cytophagales bacterium]|nr:DUF504 domain-containing protein [Cytophagales bacterium]